MKTKIAAISLLSLSSMGAFANTTIYLLAGQSNMDGRANISDFAPSMQSPLNSVDYYYGTETNLVNSLTTIRGGKSETNQTGVAVPMAHYLNANLTGNIALIKYGNGASGFSGSRWAFGGTNTTTGDGADYRNFQSVVSAGRSALAAANPSETYIIGGVVWVQGEKDARDGVSTATYQSNLTGFIADMRLTYGADLPFYFSSLSDNQTDLNATNLQNIQTAQENVNALVANTHLLNTDSFSMANDNLHFDADGYTSLGNGLGQLIVNTVPEPSSTALLGIGALALIIRRNRA